ncbi:outer membrane protein assembly factor BamD [Mucilaginibacter myungsuensis]|uniref:Outer membrane protein assembly factor BamD n=1 Tax=Mucilaginibacter myungsuensis TaxID=649104 RepID=A0A929KZ38_9SPHI|nr:outer membrane protein assembly factor BamD [Mucilaginibacter myungsuensis]MBE9662588.1 outer membrane protein assembly factor BamD [Mucilaginibacter myungsuensis]MDN3598008.1 outer membrane protein assembly factor BamD [Mucilaginibacter myungsuensis]
MFKRQSVVFFSVLIAVFAIVASCKSKFEKIKGSNDYTKKYQEAVRLYNRKEYSKALELFDDVAQRYRGREDAVDLFYYYAYTNYRLRDYTSARYQFKNFADTYQNSPRAEECRFMAAYCYYLDSPNYTLDQDNTSRAIDALQLFINLYPKSDRVAEASKLIADLRNKLEEKAFANANLHLTILDYQAAVITFNNALRDYPDTKYAEEMEYLIIKSQYLYAKNSSEFKQEERYNAAITFADQFTEKYPASKYLKDAANYKKDSERGIQQNKLALIEINADMAKARKAAQKDSLQRTALPSIKQSSQKIPAN